MEEERKFKAGDVVELKSGSRPMTVVGYANMTNEVMCVWVDDKDNRKEGSFPEEALTIYQPPKARRVAW